MQPSPLFVPTLRASETTYVSLGAFRMTEGWDVHLYAQNKQGAGATTLLFECPQKARCMGHRIAAELGARYKPLH